MFERYTEAARRSIFFARYEASQTGSAQIEPEHLLLGILRENADLLTVGSVGAIVKQLRAHFPLRTPVSASVDLPLSKSCRRVLAHAEEEAGKNAVEARHLMLGILREESCPAAGILRMNQAPAAPEGFRDLTATAGDDHAGPLIGRERELERIIHILSRRTKNNALLIGEAGVGKTAIVEGLARRIASGEAPMLCERRVISLDASSLTGPRRRPSPLEALLENPPDAILFVRGLFNLAAAGAVWAVVEAMHAIEPLLARGGLQCIATGSPAGLRETIEKVGMLARHFEVVPVAPVSAEDAIRIVTSLKPQFEQFHSVSFAEGAVEMAVRSSGLFLPDRHLPDRAIDLIDEAAAAVKLQRGGEPPEAIEARRNIRRHERAEVHAIANHEFEEVASHAEEARKERARLEQLLAGAATAPPAAVTPADIEAAIAARTGMPPEAVRQALDERVPDELARIAAELAAQVSPDARAWVPFLAAWLLHCSPAEAESVARIIRGARSAASAPPGA
jgi:ATP-dependent Clp protease ATP-binding subunit ClpC